MSVWGVSLANGVSQHHHSFQALCFAREVNLLRHGFLWPLAWQGRGKAPMHLAPSWFGQVSGVHKSQQRQVAQGPIREQNT